MNGLKQRQRACSTSLSEIMEIMITSCLVVNNRGELLNVTP